MRLAARDLQVYQVEAGDPGATLGMYPWVMAVPGLEADIEARPLPRTPCAA